MDAVGLTSLSIRNLVDGEEGFEATAQFYAEVDGERVVGYGAFGFREEDEALREAFNLLNERIGPPQRVVLILVCWAEATRKAPPAAGVNYGYRQIRSGQY